MKKSIARMRKCSAIRRSGADTKFRNIFYGCCRRALHRRRLDNEIEDKLTAAAVDYKKNTKTKQKKISF